MVGKKKTGAKPRRERNPSNRAMQIVRNRGWDQAALAWAKLLADPCGAKLVPPCFPSGGGILMRSRTIVTVGNGAGEVAGVLHWLPSSGYYIQNGTSNPNAGFTTSAATIVPPWFSGGTARSPMCIAACMRVIPNASELNRSGVVYMGNTSGAMIQAGQSGFILTNAVRQLTYSLRAPDQAAELIWLPRNQDVSGGGFLSGTTYPDYAAAMSALTVAFVGAQPATGYTIELIGVYEVPLEAGATGGNLGAVNQYQPPASTTNWQEVVRTTFDILGGTLRMAGDAAREINRFAQTISSVAASPGGRLAIGTATRLALTM